MIWLICWISRRLLHSEVPMISSTSQRLPWKTCGLFDTGSAGDAEFITSTGLNAADAPSDFRLEGQGPSFYPEMSGVKTIDGTTEKQQPNKVDSWFDDLDPDMSGDPLGDDSMEAFINLDKFLNGNSFFDEDGNLTVPDEREAEVTPVINFTPKTEVVTDPAYNNLNLVTEDDQDFLLSSVQSTKTAAKPSRKRTVKGGIKTSLYEIPPTSVIPDIFQDTLTSDQVAVDTELDHDYSTKRQRMSLPVGNDKPSTSGTMKKITQKDLPQNVVNECDNVQSLDESLDKQTIRRIKNNHASKRSREQRKQKFVEMDMEADELVIKNKELREKIVELEKLAKEMKAVLVAKMAGKSV